MISGYNWTPSAAGGAAERAQRAERKRDPSPKAGDSADSITQPQPGDSVQSTDQSQMGDGTGSSEQQQQGTPTKFTDWASI